MSEAVITQNKKVKVRPIERFNGVYDKSHDGHFMYTQAEMSLSLPIDASRNQLKQILSPEEQIAYEKKLQLKEGDMSFYKKDNEFWAKFRVKLTKEGLDLDLNDPMDMLKFKVLKANRSIAPSASARLDDAAYKFYIEEEDTILTEKSKKADVTISAYKHFGKIEDSLSKMKNVLKLAGKTNIPKNADVNFLKVEIEGLIKEDANAFVDLVNDKFEIKCFIEDALECRAIEKVGRIGYKMKGVDDGEKFADGLNDAIEFFENAHNQDLFLKVKAQINNKK